MKTIVFKIILLVLFVRVNTLHPDVLSDSTSVGNDKNTDTVAAQTKVSGASEKQKKFKIFGYPYLFYKPETSLAFGASVITYFRLGRDTVVFPSKIVLSGYYTINKQWNTTLNSQFYLIKNKLQNSLKLSLSKDIDRFYGIGNETDYIDDTLSNYNLSYYNINFDISAKLIKSMGDELYTGIGFIFGEYFPDAYKDNPYLGDNSIPIIGREGGQVTGFGLTAIFDTRDNVFFPMKGHYHQIKYKYYPRLFENSFQYQSILADIRFYQTLASEKIGVLGFQIYGDMTFGDVPFFNLPRMGGANVMRGYYLGRYRDKVFYSGQVEYRKQVFSRFYLTAFFGMGRVTDKFKNITLRDLHNSYGLGVRFVLDVIEKLNIRCDVGFGQEGYIGVYFAAEEAF